MKRSLFVISVITVLGCSNKPSLTPEDTQYIQTTVDLLRARANFPPTMDSAQIKFSLDSVYRQHHTSGGEYRKQSAALADDPKHAEAVFAAISDSLAKK